MLGYLKFWLNFKYFHSMKYAWNCHLQNICIHNSLCVGPCDNCHSGTYINVICDLQFVRCRNHYRDSHSNHLIMQVNMNSLTPWSRITHICIGNLIIIGSDNGPLGTNFSEILIKIHTFSFKKMHLKLSFVKWLLFCLGLSVLKSTKYLAPGIPWCGMELDVVIYRGVIPRNYFC